MYIQYIKEVITINSEKNNSLIKDYLNKFEMSDVFSDELISHMTLAHYLKGEDVIKLSQEMDNYYLLVKGKLKIYTLQENGKKVLIRFYTPMNVLGDLEYITDYPARTIIEALQDSTLISVPMKIIREHTYDSPEFLRFVIKTLSHKLYTYSTMSSLNLVYPLENRLASYLESISQLENQERIDEIRACNMEEMADLLCTSYRHLSRVLSDFENRGILKRNRGKIKILDFNKLQDLSVGLFE